jgi:signal transduction histidine kinase
MPVDIHDILHVLAHELRTPIGIAHGYLRLLLEDRLTDEPDRKRALEQMQKALSRLGALSHETTTLASFYEQDGRPSDGRAGARQVINRVAAAEYTSPVTVDAARIADSVMLRTPDASVLANALVDVVRATAREIRGETCTVSIRVRDHRFELLAGPSGRIEELSSGPDAPGAGPLPLERGGLGLTLVHAAVVLDAHGGERWALNGSRQTAGIRLPLEEPQP